MIRRLRTLPGFAAAVLALALTFFVHVAAAAAPDTSMAAMDHDPSMTLCAPLCTSVVEERRKAPHSTSVQEDGTPLPSAINTVSVTPHNPESIVAHKRFRGRPRAEVPLYLQIQLLRL